MTRLRPVTSLLMPELEPYRMMKRSYDQHLQGIFIAEGKKWSPSSCGAAIGFERLDAEKVLSAPPASL